MKEKKDQNGGNICLHAHGSKMKIKADFITNSSSVSYIVCVPDWFELNIEDEKVKIASEDFLYDEEITGKELFEQMKELLKKLKDKTKSVVGQCEEESMGYHALCHYFHLSDFLITSFETGEHCGFIENIKVETLNELFISVNKDLIYNSLKFLEKEKND